MFELSVRVEFAAAHRLEGYPGDCARPHGHNWIAEVFARSKGLDSIGIAIDFRDLKKAVNEIVSAWDHRDLNLVSDFEGSNPSAERLAQVLYEKLDQQFQGAATWIDRVTIWENARSAATYLGRM